MNIDPAVWALSAAHPELRPAWLTNVRDDSAPTVAPIVTTDAGVSRKRRRWRGRRPMSPMTDWRERFCGPRVFMADILRVICAHHGVTPEEIRSTERHYFLVRARHEFVYLAATLTGQSTVRIGCFIGLNHSSVLHGIHLHAFRNDLPLPRRMVWRKRFLSRMGRVS